MANKKPSNDEVVVKIEKSGWYYEMRLLDGYPENDAKLDRIRTISKREFEEYENSDFTSMQSKRWQKRLAGLVGEAHLLKNRVGVDTNKCDKSTSCVPNKKVETNKEEILVDSNSLSDEIRQIRIALQGIYGILKKQDDMRDGLALEKYMAEARRRDEW